MTGSRHNRFKHMTTKSELLKFKNDIMKQAEMLADDIDRELENRKSKKVWKSQAQYEDEQAFRHFDKHLCDFIGCKKEALWRSTFEVSGEKYFIFACGDHTEVAYNPRHRCDGNCEIKKDE